MADVERYKVVKQTLSDSNSVRILTDTAGNIIAWCPESDPESKLIGSAEQEKIDAGDWFVHVKNLSADDYLNLLDENIKVDSAGVVSRPESSIYGTTPTESATRSR